MPRDSPQSPCAMRSTRPESQRWSGKSVMIILSEPVPYRCRRAIRRLRSSDDRSEQSYRFVRSVGIGKKSENPRHRACGTETVSHGRCVRAEPRKNGKRTVERGRNTDARNWPRAPGPKTVGQDSNLVIEFVEHMTMSEYYLRSFRRRSQ